MSLPVSQEIATNNPYLESVYSTDGNGNPGHFLQCSISQELCTQITIGKTILHCQDVRFSVSVAKSIEPQPIPCTECPTFRNSLVDNQTPEIPFRRKIIPNSEFLL